MIIYGRNPVHEALRGPRRVHLIWATKNAAREQWLASSAVRLSSAEEIVRRCGTESHQGVCAEVEEFQYCRAEELLDTGDGVILALDQVQDPQNLGAICRSAECAGVLGVVLAERRAADVTPAVCKASAGAVEHLRIAKVRNVADFLSVAKARGAWVYGADAGGQVPYDKPDYSGLVVLVLGSEGRGLRPRVAASCDAIVTIPQRGAVRSLSVAAAAAVLMYAAIPDQIVTPRNESSSIT